LGVSCDEFRRNGAFAEYVTVPARISYKLPDGLPFEHAALIEAVSIAVHAANRTPTRLGDTAVVVGSGMIGLLVVQAIRLVGCSRVIAIDLDDNKLKLAKEFGADHTLNPNNCNVVEQVREITGRGADVALEVVGASSTVNTAIDCVRRGGSVCLVGNLAPKVELPLQKVVTRELSIYGSCASNGEIPQCIDLLSQGAVKVQPLITALAKLEEGPDWFQKLYDGHPGAMKVVLQPN
jgi:L-iditol 2-dehydrogenase